MRLKTLVRLALAVGLLAGPALATKIAVDRLVPAEGTVATGLLVGGRPAGPGQLIDSVVRERIEATLSQRVSLLQDGQTVLEATLAELGATVDEATVRAAVSAVGHQGPIGRRLDDALEARAGRLAVTIPVRLGVEQVAERLALFKSGFDLRAAPARWDWAKSAPIAHEDGRAADVYGAAETLVRLASAGGSSAELPATPLHPRATAEAVSSIDRGTLISRYQTRFAYLGGQAGRAQNIARAASGVDGMVLMPDDIVSFNDAVGPRSLDNGFARAGEIYKGEMRLGVGGGTCQVASTFYSAAFFAGLDVVERSPHSRPSGYVPIGLDATVVFPDVDLKLRNPFPFPIVVHAVLEPGSLAFELYGKEKPVSVELATAPLGRTPYKREVREVGWLAAGKVVCKQKGVAGTRIKKIRRIHLANGNERVEETTDAYPATNEIFLVPPGTDVSTALPPLPTEVAQGPSPVG